MPFAPLRPSSCRLSASTAVAACGLLQEHTPPCPWRRPILLAPASLVAAPCLQTQAVVPVDASPSQTRAAAAAAAAAVACLAVPSPKTAVHCPDHSSAGSTAAIGHRKAAGLPAPAWAAEAPTTQERRRHHLHQLRCELTRRLLLHRRHHLPARLGHPCSLCPSCPSHASPCHLHLHPQPPCRPAPSTFRQPSAPWQRVGS